MLYIRASSLLASATEHARTYYHYASDEMGSTTHIVDGEGAVQNRYVYDAWGNATEQTENVPNRFKFNGQQLDPITQQYYLRARFYNPVIARFTQEDTYRGDGLNLYAYCANNPICYADPSGNQKSSPWGSDDRGRTTYTDANGNTYKQDANGRWHDSSGQFCPDPAKPSQQTVPTPSTPNAKPHGNSIDSTNLQHGYEIYNVQTGDVVKTGISGQPLNQNGSSTRANAQVNKLNQQTAPGTYEARVVSQMPDRRSALAWEKTNSLNLWRAGNSMSIHKRPRPWE